MRKVTWGPDEYKEARDSARLAPALEAGTGAGTTEQILVPSPYSQRCLELISRGYHRLSQTGRSDLFLDTFKRGFDLLVRELFSAVLRPYARYALTGEWKNRQ